MPDLSLLWAENFPVAPHAIMALAALALGAAQLAMAKGTACHRVMGYLWIGLVTGVAVTGLFIHELHVWGQYSPVHLLVPVVLASLWLAIRSARSGAVRRHGRIMLSLYFLALVLTGVFTLSPGRVLHRVLFGAG